MSRKSKRRAKFQSHKEPFKKEILGIVLLLIAIILGVSLFSYFPNDQPVLERTDPMGKSYNLFGRVGVYLADRIFHFIGFSSFWLVVIFLYMALLSFRGHTPSSPIKGIIALLFMIFSFSGIMSLQLPETVIFRGGKVISGGLVGLHVSGLLKGFLNYFGAYVLLLAIFVISFMVCTHLTRAKSWCVEIKSIYMTQTMQ